MLPSSADTAADHDVCRALIRQGSRSFYAAGLLLPAAARRDAFALYAFCRLSDDAVDEPDARADAVDRLRSRLAAVYDGVPGNHAVDRAFADVVARSGLPRALPEALLEGLAWDAQGRRYRTLADLSAYAARVAGTVGGMMTVLLGVRDPQVLARACDLGVAMQFTNIARDVGEDARNGRVYLPLDWLDEVGIAPDDLIAAPVADARLRGLVARLLAEAETLYDRALAGIPGLPSGSRPAIRAARLIYREIGRDIARSGHDSVTRRAVVPGRRKLALVLTAMTAPLPVTAALAEPPLPQTRFLVEAAAGPSRPVPPGAIRAADERVGRIIEMLGRVEHRRRTAEPVGWSG